MRRDIHKFLTGYTTVDSLPPQEKPAAAERAALAAGARDGADWAIVVTHGMGQQVHFETLEQIAVALRSAELRSQPNPSAAKPIVPRAVHLRNAKGTVTELVRAEMNVTGSDGRERTVHVYESYWAPLTEGQATLTEVTSFMAETFLRGLWFVTRYRGFNRWEFGKMQQYATRFFLTLAKLLVAILIFLGPLLLANLLTVGQAVSLVMHPGTGKVIWESFTIDVAWMEIFIAIFGVSVLIFPALYRAQFLAGRAGFLRAVRTGLKVLAIAMALAGLAGAFCAELLVFHKAGLPVSTAMRYVVWGAALAEGLIGRWFLIEYMGDVAIYVTSFKVSRWDEVRGKIKKTVENVVGAVYAARSGPDGKGHLIYPKVMVVGHSLGSVISYDILNQLVLEDELAMTEGRTHDVLEVTERTKLMLTFGSPLDKTAFLFRTKGSTDELSQAAAAAWQPMIRAYGFRPEKWINIWSWFDIVSAPLHYYDVPGAAGGGKRIKNITDGEAFVPLVAHTEYWNDDLLGDTMYREL
jgi:hypothetical protein